MGPLALIPSFAEAGAKIIGALAGREAITTTKGAAVKTDVLTDEELAEAERIRDAQARKAKR